MATDRAGSIKVGGKSAIAIGNDVQVRRSFLVSDVVGGMRILASVPWFEVEVVLRKDVVLRTPHFAPCGLWR